MNKIIGVLIIVCGIALSLYLGVYVCLIGGIVQIIEAVKQTPVPTLDVAWGIVRVLLSSLVGWGSFALCFVTGGAFLADS
ncbi:hypothetical protein [Mesoterricola silvestris]|uniref:Uncharacterized protein n=1 Tax=Mesoterricola silvestris TaxID=2927979 RepID=A0AA48H5P8_9BACT|nr:hypothetical protein [Mesoterricola silvestris]BDU72333.1 hypothetical protein METEAL_15070 [Mesoterricola silvestris]